MLLASGSEHEGTLSTLTPTCVEEVFLPNSGIPGYNQHSRPPEGEFGNQLLPAALAINPLSGTPPPTAELPKILKGNIFF